MGQQPYVRIPRTYYPAECPGGVECTGMSYCLQGGAETLKRILPAQS
jgi:hypothetical protein